jgi:streptomycin 6-kinase
VTLISVPERFVADTLAREGEAARPWLARLPELIGELCLRWGLRVVGDPMHGYMALVVPVLRGDARYAHKVSWLDGETVNEAAALALWQGDGAVRLLEADGTAGALLLEWLDPRRRLAEVDLSIAVPIAGRLPYPCQRSGQHRRRSGCGSGRWTWPRTCRDGGGPPGGHFPSAAWMGQSR